MNYLAHAYLSGKNEQLLVGNFIADAVKGKAIDDYPEGVRNGIVLHRAIDEYTDNHPMHKLSRQRLHPRYGHYAGVMIDIYYDHFLAVNWSSYAESRLSDYTSYVYSILQKNSSILPEKINYMLRYMIPQNWLLNYANFDGVRKVFQGLANRTKFESKMESGVEDLQAHYGLFEAEFKNFFPQLKSFVENKMNTAS